ncbi:MAG: hypothetical protein WC375_05245, partial [Methanomassiliicoccales archaeon]
MVDNTWIAAAPGLASDDDSWSLGHKPIQGETPIFDGTVSGNNCSWDYAISDLAAITLQGTGGGVVSQAAAVGCGAGAISISVWTWNTSTFTLNG